MTQDTITKLEGMLRVKENAKEMYSLAEALFKSSSMTLDKEGMMVSDYYRAYYYYYFKNNVSKAMNFAKAALNAANEAKNTKYIVQSADLVGVLSLRKFEVFNALETLLLSYNVASKIQDKRGIIASTVHIGDLFFEIKDYQKAFSYYVEARDMAMRNEIERDVLFHHILFKHIVTSIMLNKIEILDSTINIAVMNFEGALQAPFLALKDILSLLKRLQYIERSIVEDIYAIFVKIDDIEDARQRARVALLISTLVERTDDTDLIIDYSDLLDTYKVDVKSITLKEEIESTKATLLGFDTESEQALGYAEILANENSLMAETIDFAIKKILSLQVAESERDNEILKNKELEQISATDELTGLYNRRTGVAKIEETLTDPSMVSYAFIMLDIDNFKQINDNFGHGVGDQTLIFLSKTLKEIFETDSIITRLGGDEFVVLLYNLPTQYDIRKSVGVYKVNLLINYLSRTTLDYLNNSTISVSCGVVLDDGDFDSLYQKSDIALYSSKAAGKGIVTVYDGGDSDELPKSTTEAKPVEENSEDVNITGKLTLEDAQKAEEARKQEIAQRAIEKKAREAKEREEARAKALAEAKAKEEELRAAAEAMRKKTEEEIEEEAETEVIGGTQQDVQEDTPEAKAEADNELDQLLNSFTEAAKEAEERAKEDDDEDTDDEEDAPVMHLDPKEILRRRREAILKAANMDMDSDDDDDEDEDDDDEEEKPNKVDPKELLRQRREAIRAKAMAASKASNVDEDDVNGEDDEPDDDDED